MAIDVEPDPYTKAYKVLWKLATDSARVISLVKPTNIIRYDLQSDLPPDKDEVSQGDLPELSLVPVSLTGKLRANSSSSMSLMRYEWWIATGQEGLANAILPLTFAIYAAMAKWPESTADGKTPLLWRGEKYITRIDLLDANFGLQRPEQNRGVKGWGCVWACEVEMYFRTSDLVDALARKVQ